MAHREVPSEVHSQGDLRFVFTGQRRLCVGDTFPIVELHLFNLNSHNYSAGSFYSGDSYIILNTYKKKDSDALAWDVHFWLGKYTTQDEAGTAAYKTVELDDLLKGAPVQHREVQGHESDLFLSYFQV